MCPILFRGESQWDSFDREQPNRTNSVLRTGMSLEVTKAITSYTTLFPLHDGNHEYRKSGKLRSVTCSVCHIYHMTYATYIISHINGFVILSNGFNRFLRFFC